MARSKSPLPPPPPTLSVSLPVVSSFRNPPYSRAVKVSRTRSSLIPAETSRGYPSVIPSIGWWKKPNGRPELRSMSPESAEVL